MKPIIGIIPAVDEEKGNYFISEANIEAIRQSGGMPIVLLYDESTEYLEQMIELIDGLYVTGGNDIDPTFFGEEPHPQLGEINRSRDAFEIVVIQEIIKQNKPILAVCRGSQILNIALGGDMYQDIYAQMDCPLLQHQQNALKSHASHYVQIKEGSILHQLVGKKQIKVNSRHHQANRKLGSSLIVSGESSDGIIEAIESQTNHFVLGVQWHPEDLFSMRDDASIQIYAGFIAASQKGEKK